jgi:hypothetical protein
MESLALNFVTVNVVPKVADKDGTLKNGDAVKYHVGEAKVK